MDDYMLEVLHYLAESGVEDAMNKFIEGVLNTHDDDVTDEQADMAVQYLKQLADKGNHESLQSLGTLHYTGYREALTQDYALARDYYHRAAELSEIKDNWALNNLGCCYYFGLGGDIDYKKAYSCFALSAMYGNPNAMYKLGDMYYYGKYVDKDFDASFYWYTLAKERDVDVSEEHMGFLSASISMRIGRALLFGEGTDIDVVHALYELRAAEVLFYNQTLNWVDPSKEQIPKVKELIKIAEEELDKIIDKFE